MENKNNIQEELKTIAPLLVQQQGKKEAFKVPENYFSNLEKQVLQQIQLESKVAAFKPKTKIFQLSNAMLGKAAAIVLLVGASIFFLQQKLNIPSLSSEEIVAYMADNIQEFDEDLLIEQGLTADLLMQLDPLDSEELNMYMEEMAEGL